MRDGEGRRERKNNVVSVVVDGRGGCPDWENLLLVQHMALIEIQFSFVLSLASGF